MPDLELELSHLGAAIDWPATPQLSSRVAERLTIRPAPRLAWLAWPARPRLAVVASAILIIVATLLAYTPSRDAIAGWVDLHVLVQRVEHPPTPSPLPSGPLGERLGLGAPTTMEAAQVAVSWQVLVPSSLGPPDEVYLQPPPTGPAFGEVTLVYASRPGIPVSGQTGVSVLITEARGTVDQNFFGKVIGPQATYEQVTVAGHQGFWVTGSPHDFFFVDGSGNVRSETMRLATNTLVFDDGGTIVRIEGDLTLAQATAIATSMG